MSVWIPIDPQDLPQLEALLARADPFVTAAVTAPFPYRLESYLGARRDGVLITALLDRNLTSRAIRLALGTTVPIDENAALQYMTTAGLMAFLITADALLEPNVSLYEAGTQPRSWPNCDLAWFRQADNIHPQAYVDVALGRRRDIPPDIRHAALDHRPEPAINFGAQLYPWRAHRLALTKIAVLARDTSLSSAQRLRSFIDWSVDEAFVNGAALVFATMFFAQRNAPKIVKHLYSRDPERCLAGIRNAAWDLTYLTEWVRRARNHGSQAWLFCSMDRALAMLARNLVIDDNEATARRARAALFRANWPIADATTLETYQEERVTHRCQSTFRAQQLQERFSKIDTFIAELEAVLRSTCP